MKKTRKLLAKLMVFALILAYIPTPAENVSAASDKVTTKKYTLSKKAGTYTSAFKLTIKAVKGYKVYYSTGSNLNIKKVVKSGKKKTIKISKTTTLKIYAVKKSATITKKKLKTSTVKKKTKSYKYVISTSTGTDSATNNTNDTSTTTNTDSSNANTANTNNSNSTTNTNSSSSNASTATDTATNSDGANTDSSSTGTNDSADQSSSEAGEQPGNQNQDTPTTPPDGSQEQDTQPTPPDGNNGETSDTSGQKSQEDAQSEIDTAVDTATDTTKEAEEAVTGTTPLTDESVESIDLSTLSSLESTNVEISTEDNTTKITIKNTGKYELSGSVTDTIIEVPKSVKDTVEIDLNGVTIDDSSLTASPVINSTNAPLVINLNGNSTITGSGYVTENDVVTKTANGIIYNKKAPITITGDGTLNIIDPNFNNDATYNDDVDPSDGIASKDSVIIESGTVTVKANGDALKGTGSGTYDYTDISDTDANYYDADGNLDWDSYYAQAVTDGKYTTNSDETITVNYPCTYESGGITINGGTLNLSSALGKGISSKNGLVTITDGQININSADHAISAKNYNVQITGGTINIGTGENECGGDGIKAGDTARITGGNVTIGNCYGDGIQAENVVIADGTLNIKTYYEYANTNFCKTNSVLTALNISGYNTSSENESTGLKTESVVYDTGSHKAIKAGTKQKTFTYGEITDSESDYEAGKTYYQAASGGLTITGGTITLDTTNSGIKYNGNGDSQTIIGSPDDAIHSNNDATISGGTIDIYSSDDGISVVNNLYFLNDASVKVNTAYEGIEASNIVMGTTDTDFAPTVSVYSNDDGINAAKKNKGNYITK